MCPVCGGAVRVGRQFCSRLCSNRSPARRQPSADRCRRQWADPVWAAAMRQAQSRGQLNSWDATRRATNGRRIKRLWREDVRMRQKLYETLPQRLRWGRYEYLDRQGRLWTLRSGDHYERGFARWLDEQHFTWWYEPCVLLLSDGRRYIPDFWVEEWQSYVEVKGAFRGTVRGLDKVELATADGYRIRVVRGLAELRELSPSYCLEREE